MSERRHTPWKVKVATAILPIIAFDAACGGSDNKSNIPAVILGSPTVNVPPTLSTLPSEAAKTVAPTVTPRAMETSTASPVPTATRPNSTQAPEINMAAKFGGGLNEVLGGAVVIKDSESLRGLKEFTILSRVRVSGFPPDAVFAKGDGVEAYALFTMLASCTKGDMALVVAGEKFCSGLSVPRGEYVNIAVTLKDGKARFVVGDVQTDEFAVNKSVPVENGSGYIGSSPSGLTAEGFSGEMDYLAITKALSFDQIKEGFALLQGNDTKSFVVKNGDVFAVWTFNGNYNDSSGRENNGKPQGAVTLVDLR